MLHLFSKLFVVCALLALQLPPATEEAAWTAAMALKQKAADPVAAAAFEKFRLDHPQSTRVITSRIEEGVCWFSSARAAQVLHRTTPKAQEQFDKAMALFRGVTTNHASSPEASRACYMQGSTNLFQGKLEQAEADFSAVLDKFPTDKVYVGKALGQRADVRRQLLRSAPAIADMQRWIKEFGTPGKQLETVKKELARAQMLDKQAPLYEGERWYNGEPAPLELQSGNVVALCFFATWCTNCATEMPFVLDLERRFAPKGVRFIGILDTEKGQTPEVVRQYLIEKQFSFTVLQDNHAASNAYKIDTIPMMALIDRNGMLRWCDSASVLRDSTIEKLIDEGLDPSKK